MSEQLPYDTAPELVPEIAEHVDAPESVESRADEIARRFGGTEGDHIGATPPVLAAAAVWVAASFEMKRPNAITQRAVATAAGINAVSVRNAKHRILDEMGVTA